MFAVNTRQVANPNSLLQYLASNHQFSENGTPGSELMEVGNTEIKMYKNVNMGGNTVINGPQNPDPSVNNRTAALELPNGGAYINQDLWVEGKIQCDTINNIRPSGGVYSESPGATVFGGTGKQILLNQVAGTSYGSLTVPANNFQPGDTYSFKVGGAITCANNDAFTLDIVANPSTPTEATFATITIQIDGAQNSAFWELEVEFIVRALGGQGTAAISTNGHFSYFNSTNVSKGYGINNTNQNDFDTTVSNELQLCFTALQPFGNLGSLRVDQVSLTKLY